MSESKCSPPRAAAVSLPALFEIAVVDEKEQQRPNNASSSLPNIPFKIQSAESAPSTPSCSTSKFFLDECPALLKQVPDWFDLRRTAVRLNCVAASPNYVALGSDCGALFLFNRRIGQGVKPLRTNYSEVVTQMEFHSSREAGELLAVGHSSGKLVILSLPHAESAKLLQHIQDEAHRGSALTRLCWSHGGQLLFSADQSGLVLGTRVDFHNDDFPIAFVGAEHDAITALCCSADLLAVGMRHCCKVYNWREDGELVAQVDQFPLGILALVLLLAEGDEGTAEPVQQQQQQLVLFAQNGSIWRKDVGNARTEEAQEVANVRQCGNAPEWSEHTEAIALPQHQTVVLWGRERSALMFCKMLPNALVEVETLNLGDKEARREAENEELKVLSLCASAVHNSDELFALCSAASLSSRVFRIGRHCAASASLTLRAPSGDQQSTTKRPIPNTHQTPPLFGSLLDSARRRMLPTGTEKLLGRLNRELDVFLMGEPSSGDQQQREEEHKGDDVGWLGAGAKNGGLADLLLPRANGLHQWLGQLRQSSSILSAEFDHWSLAGTSREHQRQLDAELLDECRLLARTDSLSSIGNQSLPTELSCSDDRGGVGGGAGLVEDAQLYLSSMLGEECCEADAGREVAVRRKRIVRKVKQNRAHKRREQQRRMQLLSPLGALKEEERRSEWNNESEASSARRQLSEERERDILEELGILPSAALDEQAKEKSMMDLAQRDFFTLREEIPREEAKEAPLFSPPPAVALETKSEEEEQAERWKDEEEDQVDECPLDDHIPSVDLSDLLSMYPPPVAPQPDFPSSSTSSCASSAYQSRRLRPSPLHQCAWRMLPSADQWHLLEAPFAMGDFSASRNHLLVCARKRKESPKRKQRKERPHLLALGTQNAQWSATSAKASALAVNDEGTLLWRVWKGVAYAPSGSAVGSPACLAAILSSHSTLWEERTSVDFEGTVLQVAISRRHAWYLTEKEGERAVFVQMCLPELGIFFRAVDDDGRFHFAQLAASDSAVWALSGGTVVARAGMKRGVPMGSDWVEMDEAQPRKFVAVALHEHTGAGLDANANLWFVHGVTGQTPFGHGPWLKVCSLSTSLLQLNAPSLATKFAPTSEWRLKVTSCGVFISTGTAILHNSGEPLVGSTFEHVVPEWLVPNDHFARICAGAFCGLANDCLVLCQPNSDELFSFSLRRRHFTSLPALPLRVHSFAANRHRLFVLGQCGRVLVRSVGFNARNECAAGIGAEWREMRTPATPISLAVSTTTVWAVGADGGVWASRMDDPSSPTAEQELHWAQIGRPIGEEKPDQIRISPSGRSCWLFCSRSGICWYRAEVSERNWKGRLWLVRPPSGTVRVADLAVSDSAGVWALAQGTGQLHRLHRAQTQQQQQQYCWHPMEFRLTAISVDALEGRLWALDTEFRIVRHEVDIFPRTATSKEQVGEEESAPSSLAKSPELPRRTLSGRSFDSTHSWCDLADGAEEVVQ